MAGTDAADPSGDRPEPPRLMPVQPRTMVEQAAEAIVEAAARGVFLPGDRLVEAEIARDLGISRVPVREALRLLESQGIVAGTPYKGMRLMSVTNQSAGELSRVRRALELLAIGELPERPDFGPLRRTVERLREAQASGDLLASVKADIAFHGMLCRISGNSVLDTLWHGLARQLAVIWTQAYRHRPTAQILAEHEALLAALEAGDRPLATRLLSEHICWHQGFDFETSLERQRRERARH